VSPTTQDDQLLAREAVVIGLPSVSMEEAISFVGNMLVERGHATSDYVDGMLEREQKVSTFLGNGVAMPHGTFESKEAIQRTGIVVAQYPEGIDWGVGTAHLVIGLAATGEEHVQILSHIAEVLQDEDLAAELGSTTDSAHLHATLNTPVEDEDDDTSVSAEVTITSEAGLHARPASLIVEYAKGFDGEILISKDGRSAKANSIMSLLSLGAVSNDTVEIDVNGEDAEAALAEITRILTTPEAEL
jgi:phosphocarrier protein FPr